MVVSINLKPLKLVCQNSIDIPTLNILTKLSILVFICSYFWIFYVHSYICQKCHLFPILFSFFLPNCNVSATDNNDERKCGDRGKDKSILTVFAISKGLLSCNAGHLSTHQQRGERMEC